MGAVTTDPAVAHNVLSFFGKIPLAGLSGGKAIADDAQLLLNNTDWRFTAKASEIDKC